jgi:hypothetical protein
VDDRLTPTTKVTEILSGLLETSAETTLICPLYVPGVKPPPFAWTLRVAGVVPPEGVTDSQPPPDDVVAVAVKVAVPPELVVREMLTGAGGAPPVAWVKESVPGEAARVIPAATRRVMAMV